MKGDDPKSKDKGNNITGTGGAFVEATTKPEDSDTSSWGDSIGSHVLEATGQLSRPIRSVEEILGVHPISDDLLNETNPSDVSIDTANSEEVMTGSDITEQHAFKFWASVQPKLLNMTSYKPHADDLPQNYELDFLDNLKDWNILSKTNNVTNNVANTLAIDALTQYNWNDQQSIP